MLPVPLYSLSSVQCLWAYRVGIYEVNYVYFKVFNAMMVSGIEVLTYGVLSVFGLDVVKMALESVH